MINENLLITLLMEGKWLNSCLNHKVFIPDVQGEAFLAINSHSCWALKKGYCARSNQVVGLDLHSLRVCPAGVANGDKAWKNSQHMVLAFLDVVLKSFVSVN